MDIKNISVAKVVGDVNNTILFNCVDPAADDSNVSVTKNYDDLTAAQKTKFDDFVTWFSALTE